MIEERHLKVARTARYFTYGQLSEKTEQIWFVLHGYGMLASSFIKRFNVLDEEKNLVIAPEGLSRFYWNGFGGKPVASWMTSEDRLSEIDDYIAYLDQLFPLYATNLPNPNATINVLGFSQGTATAARWLAQQNSIVHNVVFWGGPLPEDVEWDKAVSIFNTANTYLVNGTKDEFITEEHRLNHEKKLKGLGLKYSSFLFDGKHEVEGKMLLEIAKRFKGKKALIIGASGLVGGHCLRRLLENPKYVEVVSFGRKMLDIEHPKLTQKVIDFDNLEEHKTDFRGDVLFSCLGTTIKKAGSKSNFKKVDFDYPHKIAQFACENGAKKMMLVSSVGADAMSNVFYSRVKGELEDAIKVLDFESVGILRPSILFGKRPESRTKERIGIWAARIFKPVMGGSLKKYQGIDASKVGRVLADFSTEDYQGVRILASNEIEAYGVGEVVV